jgi:hypothetical protein
LPLINRVKNIGVWRFICNDIPLTNADHQANPEALNADLLEAPNTELNASNADTEATPQEL